jgi:hypothetical protein
VARAPKRALDDRDFERQAPHSAAAVVAAPARCVGAALTPAIVLGLQQGAGNAAVARVLARATPDPAPAAPAPDAAVPDATITYGANADATVMTPEAMAVLQKILKTAGVGNAQISSTARDPTTRRA